VIVTHLPGRQCSGCAPVPHTAPATSLPTTTPSGKRASSRPTIIASRHGEQRTSGHWFMIYDKATLSEPGRPARPAAAIRRLWTTIYFNVVHVYRCIQTYTS